MCCLEVGFTLSCSGWSECVSSISSCICNLEERLFWIILAVESDVMWKYLGEMQCSPALGYWQGWSALKLQRGNTSYYLKKKRKFPSNYGYVSQCALLKKDFFKSRDFFPQDFCCRDGTYVTSWLSHHFLTSLGFHQVVDIEILPWNWKILKE